MNLQSLKIALVVAVVMTLFSSAAGAGIYRYVDAEGRVHFTNVPTQSKYRFIVGKVNNTGWKP